jgi:hypothetical protein
VTETTRATIVLAAGVGLGAGLVYFLDGHRGSRRRTRVRNRILHASHRVRDAARVPLRRIQALSETPLIGRAVTAVVPRYVLELRS